VVVMDGEEDKERNMKVAITAETGSWDAQVDPRFGRAKCFVVKDNETGDWRSIPNETNLHAVQGAGIQTAQNLVQSGVDAVLTGNVGPKAFAALQAAEIKVYIGVSGTVREAFEQFEAGSLSPTEDANVEGHWM